MKYKNFDPRYYLKVIEHLSLVREAEMESIFRILNELKEGWWMHLTVETSKSDEWKCSDFEYFI